MNILSASELTRQAAAVRDAEKAETRLLFLSAFAGFVAAIVMLAWATQYGRIVWN